MGTDLILAADPLPNDWARPLPSPLGRAALSGSVESQFLEIELSRLSLELECKPLNATWISQPAFGADNAQAHILCLE